MDDPQFACLISFWLGFAVCSVIAVVAQKAAYHNGVTDGFGYSREPHAKGYQEAGDYLRRYMGHRWPELNDYTEPRNFPEDHYER